MARLYDTMFLTATGVHVTIRASGNNKTVSAARARRKLRDQGIDPRTCQTLVTRFVPEDQRAGGDE
jgi:hypothetical protein